MSTYDLAYNANQLRGPDGRWASQGGAAKSITRSAVSGRVDVAHATVSKVGLKAPSMRVESRPNKNAKSIFQESIKKHTDDEFSDTEKLWGDIAQDRVKQAGSESKLWRLTDDELKNAIVSPGAPPEEKAAALAEIRARRAFAAAQVVNAAKVMSEGRKTGKWEAAITKHFPSSIAKRLLSAGRKVGRDHPRLKRNLDAARDGVWDAIMHIGLTAIAGATILATNGEAVAVATGAGH